MARKINTATNEPIPYRRGGVIYEHIYEIELYPVSENAQYDVVLKKVHRLFPTVEWVSAFHQGEVFTDGPNKGQPKKDHYHLLLKFRRERSMPKLAEMLGVPLYLVEWKAYIDRAVQYLIHLNHPEKKQYDVDILSGDPENPWYMFYLGGDFSGSEVTELDMLREFINNNVGHISLYDLSRYASEHNILKTYHYWYTSLRDIYFQLNGKDK